LIAVFSILKNHSLLDLCLASSAVLDSAAYKSILLKCFNFFTDYKTVPPFIDFGSC